MVDLLIRDISDAIRISNLDIARKLLVYSVNCKFKIMFCNEIGATLNE